MANRFESAIEVPLDLPELDPKYIKAARDLGRAMRETQQRDWEAAGGKGPMPPSTIYIATGGLARKVVLR